MKKVLLVILVFLGLILIGNLADEPTTTKEWDPVKLYGLETTWWEETVWFFEDLFESDNDDEIKQLKSRIKYLERNQTSAEKNSRKIQAIRDCLVADLEKLMCAGVD